MHPERNLHEEIARLEKALRLLGYLARHPQVRTLFKNQVSVDDHVAWEILAVQAGTNAPSRTTRNLVKDELLRKDGE